MLPEPTIQALQNGRLDSVSRRRRRQVRKAKSSVRTVLTVLVVLSAVGACLGVGAAALAPTVLRSQCSLASVRPVKLGTNSFVNASDDSLLGVIPAKKNRQQLSLAQISPWLVKATIAIEDRRFWEHGALDYTGIARAAFADLTSGQPVQGASTLRSTSRATSTSATRRARCTASSSRRASRSGFRSG